MRLGYGVRGKESNGHEYVDVWRDAARGGGAARRARGGELVWNKTKTSPLRFGPPRRHPPPRESCDKLYGGRPDSAPGIRMAGAEDEITAGERALSALDYDTAYKHFDKAAK